MDARIDFKVQQNNLDDLIEAEKYLDALALATRLIESQPPTGVAVNLHWARAEACTGLGDWTQAEAEWTQVIALVPEDAEAHCARGLARERLGDANGAQADSARAAELRRNASDSVWNHVTALYTQDLKNREKPPKNLFTVNGERSNSRTADWAHIEAACTRAIARNPRNPLAYYRRAFVNYCTRNWDALVADCTRALELNPSFVDAYSLRGSGYDRKGEIEPAIADWTRVIELKPNDPRAYSLRGFAHDQLGNDALAAADRLRACELSNPQRPD